MIKTDKIKHFTSPHQITQQLRRSVSYYFSIYFNSRFFSRINNILSSKKAEKDSLGLLYAIVCTETKLPTSLFCLNSSKGIKCYNFCFWVQSCKDLLKIIKYTVQECVIVKTLEEKSSFDERRNYTFLLAIYFVLWTAEDMYLLQRKGTKLWLVF